jgi:hypothetical protein
VLLHANFLGRLGAVVHPGRAQGVARLFQTQLRA